MNCDMTAVWLPTTTTSKGAAVREVRSPSFHLRRCIAATMWKYINARKSLATQCSSYKHKQTKNMFVLVVLEVMYLFARPCFIILPECDATTRYRRKTETFRSQTLFYSSSSLWNTISYFCIRFLRTEAVNPIDHSCIWFTGTVAKTVSPVWIIFTMSGV